MKNILKQYVHKLVIDNPSIYGGDKGNNLIALKYIKDIGKDFNYSTMESVVREKNRFLTANPQYDFRVKNKGKNTGTVPNVEVA